MIRVLVQGLNPEPWRSPQLGIKKVGARPVPVAFKDENLRGYQEALAEMVAQALAEQGIATPVFPKGTLLHVGFWFWRQLDQYRNGTRLVTRNTPDVTNMMKAAEDALQGLLFHNDRHNRRVEGELVEAGADVEPAVLIGISPLPKPNIECIRRAMLHGNGAVDSSGEVFVEYLP